MPAKTELPETRIINLADWLGQRMRHWTEHPRFPDMHWPKPAETAGWEVRTQPALLGQAIENLLDNACKYSDPGTPITIRIEHAWRGVVLTVSDRGQGIALRICLIFATPSIARRSPDDFGVPESAWTDGRGAHRKVLGGELHIDSKPGQGSRFSVYLPAVSETFSQALRPDYGTRTGWTRWSVGATSATPFVVQGLH